MGNSNSPGVRSTPLTSKAIIKSKLETAAKTGVLNLSDSNLKPNNSVYAAMWELSGLLKVRAHICTCTYPHIHTSGDYFSVEYTPFTEH